MQGSGDAEVGSMNIAKSFSNISELFKQRRTGAAAALMLRRGELDVGALLHSEYLSARVGVAA